MRVEGVARHPRGRREVRRVSRSVYTRTVYYYRSRAKACYIFFKRDTETRRATYLLVYPPALKNRASHKRDERAEKCSDERRRRDD